jgi:diphthamide synthase (EF-2-diphthine--ammonia ligase)
MLSVDKLLALIAAMNREGVEYVVFGAIAMAVHGLPRATEDADTK